ncbi:hypothetical protein GCWU000342_00148 [Shuttleworthella satelles DSM 14600]|uniref:Uncharacterized protein n=1 Tax=Shuttleworthella satelles DSM 14600 TaxID=626523 RepID=C4G853_9FIRM|nr:hypothetical protein GCWU000342_00148 [Shuttleworthia satelles DSM 14600]
MIIREEDRKYITNNIPEAVNFINRDNLDMTLRVIYKFIDRKGFVGPDYEDYNEIGRRVQRIYDHIYEDNVLDAEE